MFGFFRGDPDELLKQATVLKNGGKINEAITKLEKAYRAISKGAVVYGVETYLRLPLYLQEGNRADEAWREFNHLLMHGRPLIGDDPCTLPMSHSTIYDKMRLFLQREGQPLAAVGYGMGSYYASILGLYRQQRVDELLARLDQDNERLHVTGLLKKAKAVIMVDKVLAATAPFKKSVSVIDPYTVVSHVCAALGQSTGFSKQKSCAVP